MVYVWLLDGVRFGYVGFVGVVVCGFWVVFTDSVACGWVPVVWLVFSYCLIILVYDVCVGIVFRLVCLTWCRFAV